MRKPIIMAAVVELRVAMSILNHAVLLLLPRSGSVNAISPSTSTAYAAVATHRMRM